MADQALFLLDEKHQFRLAADELQWMVQRRGRRRWRPISYIAQDKSTLLRVLRDQGIELTPGAQRRLKALPDSFARWRANGSQPLRHASKHHNRKAKKSGNL